MQTFEHMEMVTHMVNEVCMLQCSSEPALTHRLVFVLQVVAQQVPVTRQVPKQVTNTIEESGIKRQVTDIVLENVTEMITHHVTVQKPVQLAVKRVSQRPQLETAVDEVMVMTSCFAS